MSCTLCFLHGLNSSHHSFAYLAKELGGTAKIDYRSGQPLQDSVIQVAKQLPKKGPIVLIGHSLGGVIAMKIALAQTHDIQKVVTISAPLGGSMVAFYMRWIASGMSVLDDIMPSSAAMREFQRSQPNCPVLSIVSTTGHMPVISVEPNDSVVTISSQRALPYAKKIEVKANHFEILLHNKTVETIRKFTQPET